MCIVLQHSLFQLENHVALSLNRLIRYRISLDNSPCQDFCFPPTDTAECADGVTDADHDWSGGIHAMIILILLWVKSIRFVLASVLLDVLCCL